MCGGSRKQGTHKRVRLDVGHICNGKEFELGPVGRKEETSVGFKQQSYALRFRFQNYPSGSNLEEESQGHQNQHVGINLIDIYKTIHSQSKSDMICVCVYTLTSTL